MAYNCIVGFAFLVLLVVANASPAQVFGNEEEVRAVYVSIIETNFEAALAEEAAKDLQLAYSMYPNTVDRIEALAELFFDAHPERYWYAIFGVTARHVQAEKYIILRVGSYDILLTSSLKK